MAQVDTRSPFRHSSQHSSFYYPSGPPSHSSSSSASNSRHNSPRTSSVGPPQCYSSSSRYESYTDDSHSYHYPYRGASPQTSPPAPSSRIEDATEDTSPFPAYDHAVSSHPLSPDPILEDDEEDDDEGEDEEDYPEEADEEGFDSPTSVNTGSPSLLPTHVEDDIWSERGPAPSRHVDYLSHDWQEPDIWASWRYVRKEKESFPAIAARLENASWRTWAKSKYKLKTITPEALNWLKVSDITWLYGPLKPQEGSMVRAYTESSSSAIHSPTQKMSRSSSFNASKPILKKRSHSEVMLAGKAAQANLLTRAAQAVQEERRREQEEREFREEKRKNPLTPSHILRHQQRLRRKGSMDAGVVNHSPESPFNVTQTSSGVSSDSAQIAPNAKTDYFGPGNWTDSSTGSHTPSAVKHIHFNDRVEQCIAIDLKEEDEVESTAIDDESEDEDLYMGSRRGSSASVHRMAKVEPHSIIAKLPATRLRPGDEPLREPPQVPVIHSPFKLRDPEPSSPFYFEEGNAFNPSVCPPVDVPTAALAEDPLDDLAFDEPFESQALHDPTTSNTASTTSSRRSSSSIMDSNLEEESQRRASVAAIPIPNARGMHPRDHEGLMGEEDDDDERFGIVGLAADAISTAKDLVGVLWNAGWGGARR